MSVDSRSARIAVTGATGHIGGLVARSLADAGVPQRLIARSVNRLPQLPGADSAETTYGDQKRALAALAGIDTLFMVSAAESADRLDQHRTFIDAAAFVADPVVTLAAVADGLGVTWDRRLEGARDDLLSFVESSLPAPPPVPMASDLLEMANEVHRLLLAQETTQTSGQLDRIAAEFNDRTQALYDVMVVRELARCLHDRWELDATRLRLVAAEAALQQSGASSE